MLPFDFPMNKRRFLLLQKTGKQESQASTYEDEQQTGKDSSSANYVIEVMENEPFRNVLSIEQIKSLLLAIDVSDPDWYCKKDRTGRLRDIKARNKLHKTMALVNLEQSEKKPVTYHVFQERVP